jgi:hypothetical protein
MVTSVVGGSGRWPVGSCLAGASGDSHILDRRVCSQLSYTYAFPSIPWDHPTRNPSSAGNGAMNSIENYGGVDWCHAALTAYLGASVKRKNSA